MRLIASVSVAYKVTIRYFRKTWMPLALVLIFVFQTHLFNFWLTAYPVHYIIRRTIVSFALGLLIYGPAIFFGKRLKHLYLIITSLTIAALFILQYLYYSFSGGFLQASALLYAGEGITILGTVKTLLSWRLLLFTVGPLLATVATTLWWKHNITELIMSKKEKVYAGVFLMITIAFGYGYLFFREYTEAGNVAHLYNYNRLFDLNALINKVGIINYSLGDTIHLATRRDEATAAEADFASAWIKQRSPSTANAKNFGLTRGRNFIFILVESLENTVINKKINGQEITPYLNKLAKEGLYFTNYYAQIGPGTTADAEFSSLNSRYPLPDRVAFIEYPFNHYTALPQFLKSNGYYTAALHGDVPSFWNRANIYPQLGYNAWISRENYTAPRPIGYGGLGDYDFLTQSVAKLQALPQPFMATLITLTSHTPFEIPTDLHTISFTADSALTTVQQNYLQSVRYTDQAIGAFIEQLKSAELYDNSLIAILGDHGSFSHIGQALGDKNILSDLWNIHVPLILLAPNAPLRGITSSPASHLDIYPTVAHLLGYNYPANVLGQDLLNAKNPIMVHRNLVSGTVASILTSGVAYQAAADGVFEHGQCFAVLDKKPLPHQDCYSLYNEQTNIVNVSDILIKGNITKNAKNN